MRPHLTSVMFLVVLGLTLMSGLVQGRLRGRWGIKADMAAAASRLESTPAKFGEWDLAASQTLGESTVKMLECAGYLCGTYRNRATGDQVNMFVLLGPTGPISVHTPDICYSSREYTIVGAREKTAVRDSNGSGAEFWKLTLRSNDLEASLLRVHYAWSDGSAWTASDNPRFQYAGRPLLYKIQVAGPASEAAAEAEDPGQGFLRDFLPVLQKHLAGEVRGER